MTKHNAYPGKLRNWIALAALAGVAALGACHIGAAEAPQPAKNVASAPATPTPRETGPTEKLGKAEINLQKTSIAVAKQIVQDAARRDSLCEAYDGTAVGNKRLELQEGLENKSGFPELLLDYDPATRQVTVSSITSQNPGAAAGNENFTGINMTFQSLAPGDNNLDKKIAGGNQLLVTDYETFFDAGNLGLRAATTVDGTGATGVTTVALMDETYQYTANYDTTTPITEANSGLLGEMSGRLQVTEEQLRRGL